MLAEVEAEPFDGHQHALDLLLEDVGHELCTVPARDRGRPRRDSCLQLFEARLERSPSGVPELCVARQIGGEALGGWVGGGGAGGQPFVEPGLQP